MDQFQLVVHDFPAGPVRGSWEEAAQDAVAAGLADWVREIPHAALNWTGAGRALIARIAGRPREAGRLRLRGFAPNTGAAVGAR
jgi:hypothetical protein